MNEVTDRAITIKSEAMPSQFIIGLILELTRQMRSLGIPDIDAIYLAQDAVMVLEKGYRGMLFQFAKEAHPDKDFLCNVLTDCLMKKKVNRAKAERAAATITDRLFFAYSRIRTYFPKTTGEKASREERDAAIAAEYRKSPGFVTVKKMCKKYNLGQSHVYTIIRRLKSTNLGSIAD